MNDEIENPSVTPQLHNIDTDHYRVQTKNKTGTIRLMCTGERCTTSVILHENKMKSMRGIHRHQERVLPFHVGKMVHEFLQTAVNDFRTPLPQIYAQFIKNCLFQCVNFLFRNFLLS